MGALELGVYSYDDPKKKIDVIPRRVEPAFLDEVKDSGSGVFQISSLDPKLVKNPDLLEARNVIKATRDGKVEGAFVIQNKDDTLIAADEQGGKRIVVSGEGLKTWFRDATVHPYGGLKVTSGKDRVFSWASEKGVWYKTSDWKTPVNIYQWELLPTSSQNRWPYKPANWPDAPRAFWIWSVKDVDVPIGYNYFRYEFDTTVAGSYSVFATGDNFMIGYIDGGQIIDAGQDTATFAATFRSDFELLPGHHVLAFRVYNGGGPGALLAALFRAGDATANVPAQLLATTGDAGWVVNAYPAKEPGWSIGEILLQLLSEARNRGVNFPKFLTPTFTATADSNGDPWEHTLPWTFEIGSEYIDVLKQLEEYACDIWIDPDTYELKVWNKRGTDRTDLNNNPVILREGHNLTKAGTRSQADIKNNLMVLTKDGWIESAPDTSESATKYGRVEGQLSTDSTYSRSVELARKVFEQKQDVEESATYAVHPRKGAVPLHDFFVGDWVLAPSRKGLVKRRIVSISASEDKTGAAPVYEIEFDTIFKSREDYLEMLLKQSSGGVTTSSTGAGSATSPTTSPIGGAAPSLPRPPSNLKATSVGLWNAGGGTESRVTLVWDRIGYNEDGSTNPGIAYYEVLGRPTGSPATDTLRSLATVPGTATGATFEGISAGVSWDFYVRGATSAVRVSALSAPLTHVTTLPALVVSQPSVPTLTSSLGTVTVGWDGTLEGQTPPSYFSHVYAEYSLAENGDYTIAGQTIQAQGSIILTGLDVGTQYWVRLVAADLLGRISDPSDAAAVTVEGLDVEELAGEIRDELDQAKQDAANALDKATDALEAADGATGITYSPTDPTADTPGKNSGDTWFVRDSNGNITAQYEWTGSAWVSRLVTNSLIANLDAGKITAGTIDAARIKATSISAGLISTDMLAAEAVTAAKIKAETITAVQIAAGTIEANNIKAGTLTATQLSANSITAEKLAADAITAKHTITGALIRTAASGARTEINSSGLRVLNASGTELVRLGYGLQTGMSVFDPVANNLVPLGQQLFGTRSTTLETQNVVPNGSFGVWGGFTEIPSGLVANSPTGRLVFISTISVGSNSNPQDYRFRWWLRLRNSATQAIVGDIFCGEFGGYTPVTYMQQVNSLVAQNIQVNILAEAQQQYSATTNAWVGKRSTTAFAI